MTGEIHRYEAVRFTEVQAGRIVTARRRAELITQDIEVPRVALPGRERVVVGGLAGCQGGCVGSVEVVDREADQHPDIGCG